MSRGPTGKRTKERTSVEYHVWTDAHNLPRTYQLLSWTNMSVFVCLSPVCFKWSKCNQLTLHKWPSALECLQALVSLKGIIKADSGRKSRGVTIANFGVELCLICVGNFVQKSFIFKGLNPRRDPMYGEGCLMVLASLHNLLTAILSVVEADDSILIVILQSLLK